MNWSLTILLYGWFNIQIDEIVKLMISAEHDAATTCHDSCRKQPYNTPGCCSRELMILKGGIMFRDVCAAIADVP